MFTLRGIIHLRGVFCWHGAKRITEMMIKMGTEQKIMCAIVQVDMFLVGCWKWMLVILFIMGISIVVILNTRWK